MNQDTVKRYEEMKVVLKRFVGDYAGKGLLLRSPPGMGAHYLLRKFSSEAGLTEIRGPVYPDQSTEQSARSICFLPDGIGAKDFFVTASVLRLSLLVFENFPRSMRSTLEEHPVRLARSHSSFWGGLVILTKNEEEEQSCAELNRNFHIFDFETRGLLPVMEIVRSERSSIAERLSHTANSVPDAELLDWIEMIHDVTENRAQALGVSVSELAEKTTFSLHQFVSMIRLFPLLFPGTTNTDTKRRWIARNLGFKDFAGVAVTRTATLKA